MNHICPLVVCITLSMTALPAAAQTRSLFDQPDVQEAPALPAKPAKPRAAERPRTTAMPRADEETEPRSQALQAQDQFIERIQRSDKRATASICADGCRGEIRGRTQPADPFAPLPELETGDVPSGYYTEP